MLFKNFFKVFPDARGFLNPFDMDQLFRTLEIPNFNIRYQLISFSEEKNVFRGFHYQKKPFQQTKVLIVHRGSIKDIIFPLNNIKKPLISEYDLEAGDVILIPSNYAHGFYTKSRNVLLQYVMDQKFSPNHYSGFNPSGYIENHHFDSEPIVSDKDKSLPNLNF